MKHRCKREIKYVDWDIVIVRGLWPCEALCEEEWIEGVKDVVDVVFDLCSGVGRKPSPPRITVEVYRLPAFEIRKDIYLACARQDFDGVSDGIARLSVVDRRKLKNEVEDEHHYLHAWCEDLA